MTKLDAAAIREMLASGAWKIVPVEPTEEMLKKVEPAWMTEKKQIQAWRDEYCRLYVAMLAASPAAPDITELAEENARLRKALEQVAAPYDDPQWGNGTMGIKAAITEINYRAFLASSALAPLVAQGIEQGTSNAEVAGLNPAERTLSPQEERED